MSRNFEVDTVHPLRRVARQSHKGLIYFNFHLAVQPIVLKQLWEQCCISQRLAKVVSVFYKVCIYNKMNKIVIMMSSSSLVYARMQCVFYIVSVFIYCIIKNGSVCWL